MKKRKRFGRLDFILIRSFCTLNTHVQKGKANTKPEKNPDKQAKGLVVKCKKKKKVNCLNLPLGQFGKCIKVLDMCISFDPAIPALKNLSYMTNP